MIKLSNGIEMPCLVAATNWMDYQQLKPIVTSALKHGFRAFDTARDYGNEPIVGKVINECLKEEGLRREDIFITTKIGNGQQAKGDIANEIEISCKNLQTDYIDLWLMHWPYPNYYIETWHKMEEVYNSGRVRAIGMANCNVRYLNELYNSGITVPIHCVQFELHPCRTVVDIVEWCRDHEIAIQAYSPLCRMLPMVKDSDVLKAISQRHGKTIGQVIIRWHIQNETIPVIKTTNPNRLNENADVFDFVLDNQEMNVISSLDQNYKFHLESVCCPGY